MLESKFCNKRLGRIVDSFDPVFLSTNKISKIYAINNRYFDLMIKNNYQNSKVFINFAIKDWIGLDCKLVGPVFCLPIKYLMSIQ